RQHFTQLNSNNPGTKSSTEIKRVENKAQTLTLGNREVKERFKRNVDNCTSWQREGAGALLGAAKAAPRRPASSNPSSPNRTQTGVHTKTASDFLQLFLCRQLFKLSRVETGCNALSCSRGLRC
ncbi:hypothetical protein KQX54_005612, partial [Cotesia glomerata]